MFRSQKHAVSERTSLLRARLKTPRSVLKGYGDDREARSRQIHDQRISLSCYSLQTTHSRRTRREAKSRREEIKTHQLEVHHVVRDIAVGKLWFKYVFGHRWAPLAAQNPPRAPCTGAMNGEANADQDLLILRHATKGPNMHLCSDKTRQKQMHIQRRRGGG